MFHTYLVHVCLQQAIREGAVEALQACLVILAQRETKEMQKPPIWYTVSLNYMYVYVSYRNSYM